MKKFLFIILLLISLTKNVAQTGNDSLNFQIQNYSPRILSSLFDKQLNTYSLNDKFLYSTKFNSLFIGINEEFRSTVINSAANHIKDEQNFSLLSEYEFNSFFSSGLLVNSDIYSDDRNISINEASIHSASLYGKIKPFNILDIIPFAGYTVNRQVGETNKGLIYGSELLLKNFAISDLILSGSIKLENEDIRPRRNLLREGRVRLTSDFNKSFKNFLDVKYSQKRKDFYFSTDTLTQKYFNITNNIQSRNETLYGLFNKFLYNDLSLNSTFELNGSITLRNIERETRYIIVENINSSSFDTDIEELRLNLDGTYRFNSSNFNAFLRAQYSERQETHTAKRIEGSNEIFYQNRVELEKQKNNESKQITITASSNWDITSKDKIFLSLLHRKLTYDTPSESNYDDRDELLSLFRLGYLKKFTPLFSFYMNLEAALNHIVYIFAERSSNNNYKRFLKFNSGGIVSTQYLTTNASAEVSANYTVYDFEDLNPNFKSFAFRQFVLKDSTSIKLSSRLYADVNGYIKLSEQGDFKWNEFKTRPSRFLEEFFLLPKLVFRLKNIELGLGIRYFSLQTYLFNSKLEKTKDKLYNSVGPLSDISVNLNKLIFRLNGWYEFIRNENNTRRELVNLRFQMDWNF